MKLHADTYVSNFIDEPGDPVKVIAECNGPAECGFRVVWQPDGKVWGITTSDMKTLDKMHARHAARTEAP